MTNLTSPRQSLAFERDQYHHDSHSTPPEMWGLFCYSVGSSMKQINLVKFYRLGLELSGILAVRRDDIPSDAIMKLIGAPSWLNRFLEETDGVELPHTKEAAIALRDYLDNASLELAGAMQTDNQEPLAARVGRAARSRGLLDTFNREFEHESRDLNIFSVSNVGTHATSKLLAHAHRNLPEAVYSKLTKQVIEDVDEAGRCLGFDRPTAAGFHILRALEPLILEYHNKVTGVALPLRSRSWSAYIKRLKKDRYAARVDAKIVAMLEHIRDFYRNPVMHPQDTLKLDDALSLFHTCLSAIVQIDAATETCAPLETPLE
jgi:hypothetical protein